MACEGNLSDAPRYLRETAPGLSMAACHYPSSASSQVVAQSSGRSSMVGCVFVSRETVEIGGTLPLPFRFAPLFPEESAAGELAIWSSAEIVLRSALPVADSP